jgi:hypothetical protein
MKAIFIKLKTWISSNFQFIILSLLAFSTFIIIKQQNDISKIKDQLHDIEYLVDECNSNDNKIYKRIKESKEEIIDEIHNAKSSINGSIYSICQ